MCKSRNLQLVREIRTPIGQLSGGSVEGYRKIQISKAQLES